MPIKMPINGTTVPAIHLPLEDGYVLTGIPNYDGGKTKIPNKRSWWLTRQGWMKSTYCFSTPLDGDSMSRELTEQLTSLEEFKSLFKKVLCSCAGQGHDVWNLLHRRGSEHRNEYRRVGQQDFPYG